MTGFGDAAEPQLRLFVIRQHTHSIPPAFAQQEHTLVEPIPVIEQDRVGLPLPYAAQGSLKSGPLHCGTEVANIYTSFDDLDPGFFRIVGQHVSDSMRIPPIKTFFRVTVPLSLPAILEIFLYYFMNAMVTVSAVVFLYSAKFKIASIAITHMEEAGDFAQAAAMSLLILLVNVLARGLYEILVHRIKLRGRRQADRS